MSKNWVYLDELIWIPILVEGLRTSYCLVNERHWHPSSSSQDQYANESVGCVGGTAAGGG